jgi:hypothetical protein
MATFIDSNPGLASRFRLTLQFEDYSDDELIEIFSRIASGADFTPVDGCVEGLRTILATTERSEGFGNARFIRNLFESAVVRQAWRLRDTPDPALEQLRELIAADLTEALPDAPMEQTTEQATEPRSGPPTASPQPASADAGRA